MWVTFVCGWWVSHYSSFKLTEIGNLRAAGHHFFLLLTPVACPFALPQIPSHSVRSQRVQGDSHFYFSNLNLLFKAGGCRFVLTGWASKFGNSLACRKYRKTAIYSVLSIILGQLLKHFFHILLFGVIDIFYCLLLEDWFHLFCFLIFYKFNWLQKEE